MSEQEQREMEQDTAARETELIRTALRAALRREPSPREMGRFLATFRNA